MTQINLVGQPDWAEHALRMYASPTKPVSSTVAFWLRDFGHQVSDRQVRRFFATRVARRALEVLRKIPRRIVRSGEVTLNSRRYRVCDSRTLDGRAVLVVADTGVDHIVSLCDVSTGQLISEAVLVAK